MVRAGNALGKTAVTLPQEKRQPQPPGAVGGKGRRINNPLGGIPFLRKRLSPYGLDKATTEFIVSSAWRESTVKLYSTYLKKWGVFCLTRSVKPLEPSLAQVCRFLRILAQEGLGYGAVNTARCALSVILPKVDGQTVGKHQLIHWLLRSVYALNPPRARYNRFWDVELVFRMLKNWPGNKLLSLKDLTLKLTILLLLVTGHRGQMIVALSLEGLVWDGEEVVFRLNKLTKSNRTGDSLSTVVLSTYNNCPRICVVRALKAYIVRTKVIRISKQLLVSFIRPHGPISRDTLARWTMQTLNRAGIDTNRYGAHSTRGAAASGAKALGISVKAILKHAGWKTERAFAKHYNKNIEKSDNVAKRLLDRAVAGPR